MVRALFTLSFLTSFFAFSQDQKITFHNWTFKRDLPSGDHRPAPAYPATVPGVVHLDLMNNGLAPDFYANNNEHSDLAKKVERENWVYSTIFEISESDLRAQNLALVFEGLDTYANVYLNDSLILSADNMFRTWEIPVKALLKIGKNELRVHFTSPLHYHEQFLRDAPYRLPSGNETGDYNVSAYTRKAAYHFGWDWGPRFVTCGIWRPCYIKSWDNFQVADFYAETERCDEDAAFMNIRFTIKAAQLIHAGPFTAELMHVRTDFFMDHAEKEISFPLKIENPKIWYPNGHGSQPIYQDTLFIWGTSGKCVYKEPVKFAIRTIELINEKDSIGTSFYFKVNGKAIFMKGANYIPQDVFLPRVTKQKTENLLSIVQRSNMNMLRVWGGGIYESDHFYDVCDSLGILVWQDLMFANSMYQPYNNFAITMRQEIYDNVRRLRNHPCIAIWCGNNEIEVAWQNWGWQKQYNYSAKDSAEIWDFYKVTFQEAIPQWLEKLDPARAYISSSPQSNWGKAENFNHGAMHYWGVWHGKEPVENFENNVGRFMVEYGFQSYPTADLLNQYLDESQLHFDSVAFKNLQKSYIGNELIEAEVEKYFTGLDFNDWLWATQYVQGQALKKAIIAHRLHAPHCMGTLLWQLNDCWPGASWSILDYNQTPKLSLLQVEKWFAPTIAFFENENDSLKLTVHSDVAFKGHAGLILLKDEFGTILKYEMIPFSLEPLQTKEIWNMPLKKLNKKIDRQKLSVEISVLNENGTAVFSDTFYFRKLKIDEIY